MPAMRRVLRAFVAAAPCWLAATAHPGGGLQVSPVTLTLQRDQQADGIWISNAGASRLQAQVRVYEWTQEGGEDRLRPTGSMVVSPPMLRLGPGERQLVRAIRQGPPQDGHAEQSLRIVIDEVPMAAHEPAANQGIRFLLRYSLPIFLAPKEEPSAVQLRWSLGFKAGQPVLEVSNAGGTHAQIADVALTDASGRRSVLHAGLLGYALPGATMRFALQAGSVRPGDLGVWEATINGTASPQTVQIGATAP